jgi:limonene-1,2-epoxide hydrolase
MRAIGAIARRVVFPAALEAASRVANAEGNAVSDDVERANEEIVNRFCRDWSRQDAELLADYFTEPFEYMMYEGGPLITTREAFIKQLGPFLRKLKSVDWVVLRSHAMGPMVINERIDHFYAHDSKYDNHPRIAGLFIVRAGKIAIWRDYNCK